MAFTSIDLASVVSSSFESPVDLIDSTILSIGYTSEDNSDFAIKYKNKIGEIKIAVFEFDETGIWFKKLIISA